MHIGGQLPGGLVGVDETVCAAVMGDVRQSRDVLDDAACEVYMGGHQQLSPIVNGVGVTFGRHGQRIWTTNHVYYDAARFFRAPLVDRGRKLQIAQDDLRATDTVERTGNRAQRRGD